MQTKLLLPGGVFWRGNEKKAEAAREHEFGTTAAGSRFEFFESGKRGFVQSTRD